MRLTQAIPQAELVSRYRANYCIKSDTAITYEMVEHHWVLERGLRDQLLSTTPESRWQVFDDCYTRLYSELPWLNESTNQDLDLDLAVFYQPWLQLLGDSPLRIYEVGSGKAELLKLLAARGHSCTATEITRKRGRIFLNEMPNLRWAISDGIHLDRFEDPSSYDVVISNQVIEHMHPNDIEDHFRAVYRILKPSGRYIFSTPLRLRGPADVSRVFGASDAAGMHLREYTHHELSAIGVRAGFARTQVVLRVPKRIRRLSPNLFRCRPSQIYTGYILASERLLQSFSSAHVMRIAAKLLGLPMNVTMVAAK